MKECNCYSCDRAASSRYTADDVKEAWKDGITAGVPMGVIVTIVVTFIVFCFI